MMPSVNPSLTKEVQYKIRQSLVLRPNSDSLNMKQQRCSKDRHGKVEGRDCRVRLLEFTHKRFLQLKSKLGHRNNGQTIQWLLSHVPPSHFPGNNKLPTIKATTKPNTISSYSVFGSASVSSLSLSDSSVSLHAFPLPLPLPPPVDTETMQITSNNTKALSVEEEEEEEEEEGIEYDMLHATRNMSFVSLLTQCEKEAQPKEHSFL